MFDIRATESAERDLLNHSSVNSVVVIHSLYYRHAIDIAYAV